MGLTEGQTSEERRKTFATSILTGFALLLVFLFAGMALLDLFNVTLNDFKIAGGILLLYPFHGLSQAAIFLILAVTPAIHLIANMIAYLLGMKDHFW
jgi:small neutral amino acid transporter SnatA (MarC family)